MSHEKIHKVAQFDGIVFENKIRAGGVWIEFHIPQTNPKVIHFGRNYIEQFQQNTVNRMKSKQSSLHEYFTNYTQTAGTNKK